MKTGQTGQTEGWGRYTQAQKPHEDCGIRRTPSASSTLAKKSPKPKVRTILQESVLRKGREHTLLPSAAHAATLTSRPREKLTQLCDATAGSVAIREANHKLHAWSRTKRVIQRRSASPGLRSASWILRKRAFLPSADKACRPRFSASGPSPPRRPPPPRSSPWPSPFRPQP